MPISSHLASVRAKIGHDLLTLTTASIFIFDPEGRILLAEDADTGLWSTPGGVIDPGEIPADAAVRECFEETGLIIELNRLVGVFGGPEFWVTYPNGDLTYCTTIVFEARMTGGTLRPDGDEIRQLRFFTKAECDVIATSAPGRVLVAHAFGQDKSPYFAAPTWAPRRT
jgi:ADP-ribose pyrophosphatase YjhB (NUDIX family)